MRFFFDLKEDPIKLDGVESIRAIRPLIYVENFNDHDVVVVRWDSDDKNDEYRHEFHLLISLEQIYDSCAADPRRFKAVFIGQLKNFPKDSFCYREMVSNFDHDMERWILFAVAPIGLRDGIPVNFATEIVLIGENGRLITPETYINMDEWRITQTELDRVVHGSDDQQFAII